MRSYSVLTLLLLSACGSQVINQPPKDGGNVDTGEGVPDIEFSQTDIDFGSLLHGDGASTAITVYNRGDAILNVSAVTTNAPFSVTPGLLTVAIGGSSTVTITVHMDGFEDYSDAATFVSDDPDEGTSVVTLHALTITDEDGDGHASIAAGGDDCDDADPAVFPGATEAWYDGVDQNCDGANDWDQDGDGYETETHNADPAAGGGDCQDSNVEYHPNAEDIPYDNRDTNCDHADDFDVDGDGSRSSDYGAGTDCDDDDPAVNTDGTETFNARDDDCNGIVDDDAVAEGAPIIYDAGGSWDQVGYSAAAGDLNGDGVGDAVFGAPYVDASGRNSAGRGGVGVFLGGSSMLPTGTNIDDADTYVTGDNIGDLLGAAVSVMGDYDGDGVNDLAVGAPGINSSQGVVYLFSGADIDSASDTSRAFLTLNGEAANQLGRGIGGDLDLDGDGSQELVFCYVNGTANYLGVSYGGDLSGSAVPTDATLYSTTGTGTAFYHNAPYGGDFDGDGYQDLLVSDGAASHGGYSGNGALYAIWGGNVRSTPGAAVDIESVATTLVSGPSSSAGYAWATELGPDQDGDGSNELWIYIHGVGIYVVPGGTHGRAPFDPTTEPNATTTFYDWHSTSVDVDGISWAGDWSGDGVSDMLVFQSDQAGSYGDVELFPSEIASGVFPEHDARIANVTGTSDHGNGNVGYGLAPRSADVDGDGDDDVLMGDPEYSSNHGEGYVFLNGLIR